MALCFVKEQAQYLVWEFNKKFRFLKFYHSSFCPGNLGVVRFYLCVSLNVKDIQFAVCWLNLSAAHLSSKVSSFFS